MCYARPMRYLIFSLLLPAGCLYIGSLNHAPEGTITIDEKKSALVKWGEAKLSAVVEDKDGDQIGYQWRVIVESQEDGGIYSLDRPDGAPAGDPHVSYNQDPPNPIGTAKDLTLLRLPFRGTYHVRLQVSDTSGAMKQLETTFEVKNQAPTIQKLRIELDPNAKQDIRPDVYPAHAHYLAYVSDLEMSDAEDDLKCGNTKSSVAWELVTPEKSALEYWDVVNCYGGAPLGMVHFRLKSTAVQKNSQLSVKVTVNDGFGGKVESLASRDIVPNRPPCIPSTVPSFTNPKVVVPYKEGQTFDASQANDDVLEGLTFFWWIKGPDLDWSLIPGQTGPIFKLPAELFPAGKPFKLRVAVQSVDSDYPSCSSNEPLCYKAQGIPAACYEWVTWDVEYQ
jgi:hypothetical protein